MLASSAPQRPRLPWRVHLPDLDGKGLWRAAEATIITPSSLPPLPPSPPTQRVTLRAPDVPGVSPLPHWAGPRSGQPAYWGDRACPGTGGVAAQPYTPPVAPPLRARA